MAVKDPASDLGVQRYFTGLACFAALLLYAFKARGEDNTTWTACGFHLLLGLAFCIMFILGFASTVQIREELDNRKIPHSKSGNTLFRVWPTFLAEMAATPASAKGNDLYLQLGNSCPSLNAFADTTKCNLDSTLYDIGDSFCGYFTLALLKLVVFAIFGGWPGVCLSLSISLTVLTCALSTYYVHVNRRIKQESANPKTQGIKKSHKVHKDLANSTYSSMMERPAQFLFSFETFFFLGILILYGFGIRDSHSRVMVRLGFVLICSALICGVYVLALAYVQHLWDKLEKIKVSVTTIQNSKLSISLVVVLLFCSSAVHIIFAAITGAFSRFYLDLLLETTMLVIAILTYRQHVDCTVDEERMNQKTQEAERRTKMDQKDRKIATLESTIEGLHHQLHVLRQHRAKETEVVEEFKAETSKQHETVVQEYAAAFSKTNTACANQQKEIEALEAVLTETRSRHFAAMGKLHLDHAKALDKVKADAISETRATILADLQQQFKNLPDIPVEYSAQPVDANAEAHDRAIAQKDDEYSQILAELAGLERQHLDFLRKRHEEHGRALKDKDEQQVQALNKKDEQHAQSLKQKDEQYAMALENAREYAQALQKRDEEHDRAFQKQRDESDANFAEHLRLQLWIQEQWFSCQMRQAEFAADQALRQCRDAHREELAAVAGQYQQALAHAEQFYDQKISKERQAFHIQFEMAAQRHRYEFQRKELGLRATIDEKSQVIQDLNQVLEEKDRKIDALEYEKLQFMDWDVVEEEMMSEENEGGDDALAAAEEDDAALIDHEYDEYEYQTDDEVSDSESVASLPELVHNDEEEETEGSEPPEAVAEDDEWNEDDIDIKVDGDDDDDEDEPEGWTFVDSDDE